MKFKIEEFIRKHQKSVLFAGNGENLSEYNTGRKGHNGTPCTDHLGNKFDSYTDMCNYHGVDVDVFYYRKSRLKLPLEKCLAPVKLKHRYSKKI